MPDFGVRRIGYPHDLQAVITDDAGATVDLTGATLAASLRAADGGPAVATLAASTANPVGGVVDLTLEAEDTLALAPGTYLVGLDITDGQGRTIDGTGGERWTVTLVGGVGTNLAASSAFTVAKVEKRLIREFRGWMPPWGMDTSTGGGNQDVQVVLIRAMRSAGLALADPGAVADADLATLSADEHDEMIDYAEFWMLKLIHRNWNTPTASDGNQKLVGSDFAKEVRAAIDEKAAYLRSRYGYGLAAPSLGSIDLGFAQADDLAEF